MALPFKAEFHRVRRIIEETGIADDIVFIGSGRHGFPEPALLPFTLGCDLINVGREALMAIGCIQAQRCHTNHCPTGIATQASWLARGVEPTLKSERLRNYVVTLRKEVAGAQPRVLSASPGRRSGLINLSFLAIAPSSQTGGGRDWSKAIPRPEAPRARMAIVAGLANEADDWRAGASKA